MSFEIYNLVIELTRKCNMKCPHCLRGEPQNLNLNMKYVTSLFSRTKYISSLTLTGGEPSLVPQIIDKIIDCAHVYGVEISNFYIATNGKNIKPRFVRAVERLHNYCSDNDISGVDISNDMYHEKIKWTNGFEMLMNLDYVNKKWQKSGTFTPDGLKDGVYHYAPEQVIDEGRANYSGVAACREIKPDTIEFEYEEDTDITRITEGTLYLNCKGWIIAGCDFAFDHQDDTAFEGRICQVDDFSIEKLREYENSKELAKT